MAEREIRVDYLARVEGEGSLHVTTRDGEVRDVRLEIFEPPRFFEAFLRGRDYSEAPDITARICGICPVAYQMSAVHAMEDAFGVRVEGQLRALRRLLYCGEWIESHALHVFMLHAPDFLGYEDAVQMAAEHREAVELGLELRRAGNEIIERIGGRAVHPVNVRVGGFYRVPTRAELEPLERTLEAARSRAEEAVRWAASLPCPEYERDYLYVGLRHPDEYPFNEGRIASSGGLDIAASQYDSRFFEQQVPHSHALHSLLRDGEDAEGTRYLVGPLARWQLNFDRLPERVRALASEVGAEPPVRNPFRSIVVRCLEMQFAIEEALRIIEQYEPPSEPAIAIEPRAGTGFAATEAPRGTLYHRYRIGEDGAILDAKIVPPTSQNQPTIEDDLRAFVSPRLDLDQDTLTRQCEQVVRNYDPCISCATHFLTLEVEEEGAKG